MRLLPLVGHRTEHLEAAEAAEAHQQPVDVDDVLGSLRLHTKDPESRLITLDEDPKTVVL